MTRTIFILLTLAAVSLGASTTVPLSTDVEIRSDAVTASFNLPQEPDNPSQILLFHAINTFVPDNVDIAGARLNIITSGGGSLADMNIYPLNDPFSSDETWNSAGSQANNGISSAERGQRMATYRGNGGFVNLGNVGKSWVSNVYHGVGDNDGIVLDFLNNGSRTIQDVDLRVDYWTAGDADRNNQFNSTDLVTIFQAGKYETGQAADWDEGDFNHDGVFNSSDIVVALATGTYQGANGAQDWLDIVNGN